MDSIMRLSRMSPLHDTSPQKQIVLRRISEISNQMQNLGDIAQGPGHYAIGRGYLSLNDYDRAYEHLRQAWKLGQQDPDAAYALGLTLGHIFQQKLDAAQQIGVKQDRENEIRRLEQEYRDPAVQYLRQSGGVEETSPAYVEGLIDFYQNRFEEAEKKAESAISQVPWLYEARILQGRIFYRTGGDNENAGNYDGARQNYSNAVAAFDKAIATGPSDTEAYEGMCALYFQWIHMEIFQTGGDVPPLAARRNSNLQPGDPGGSPERRRHEHFFQCIQSACEAPDGQRPGSTPFPGTGAAIRGTQPCA